MKTSRNQVCNNNNNNNNKTKNEVTWLESLWWRRSVFNKWHDIPTWLQEPRFLQEV